jgi:hypothetical protein
MEKLRIGTPFAVVSANRILSSMASAITKSLDGKYTVQSVSQLGKLGSFIVQELKIANKGNTT